MLWHLGADRAEARRVLARVAGRLRGDEPFRVSASVQCEPWEGSWGLPRMRGWTADLVQEAPGRAVLDLGFGSRTLRVLARDAGVWSDAGAGWAGLAASEAEYVAGLPRLYSAFEGAGGARLERTGGAPGEVRVSGRLGEAFADTRVALGRTGEGWGQGIQVRDGRFEVREGPDSTEIILQFMVEGGTAEVDGTGARSQRELETVTVRADRFGDANLRVPEAPGPVEVGVGSGGTLLGAVHYCLFRVVPEAWVAAVDTEEAAGVADLADTAVAHITEVADAEAAVEVDGVAVPEGPALDASF